MARQQVVSIKDNIRNRIDIALNAACTSNPNMCCLGYCDLQKGCFKDRFVYHPKINKHKLKSILKHLSKCVSRKNGKRSPHDMGQTLWERIEIILGQPINEHPLIKNDEVAKWRLSRCTTLNMVLMVLESVNMRTTGRRKILENNYEHLNLDN